MKAVPSKTQAAAELKETLDGYVAELQAEYDKLVKDNAYTKENKTKLDEAFAAGKKAIEEAKSKTVGNQEKVKAIAAIKAIEAKAKEEKSSGCGSSLAMGAMTVVCAAAVALFANKKKEDSSDMIPLGFQAVSILKKKRPPNARRIGRVRDERKKRARRT